MSDIEARKSVLNKLTNSAIESFRKSAYPSALIYNRKEAMKIEDLKPGDRFEINEFAKDRIKLTRELFGYSQDEFAERLGVSRPTLDAIEKGRRELKEKEANKLKELMDFYESLDNGTHCPHLESFILYALGKMMGFPGIGMKIFLEFCDDFCVQSKADIFATIKSLIREEKVVKFQCPFFNRENMKLLPRVDSAERCNYEFDDAINHFLRRIK
jgi:transcriptional regulator with XRE-family HTH domain